MSLPSHLRSHKENTKEEATRDYFNVPRPMATDSTVAKGAAGVTGGMDGISCVLSIEGEAVHAGRLYLLPPYLCFLSLDRRSARFSIPLFCIRRVERLNSRAGVFALGVGLWHGLRLILQLTSLLPTAEHFCILLREALRAQVPAMKALKPFTASLYSEYLLSSANAEEDGGGGSTEGDARGPGGEGKGDYQRGLGEVFGFPGDARKLRERSKIKLWREYFSTHGRSLTLLRYPSFQRLLQVGLPSRLRGELWETLSGSIYIRYANKGLYQKILADNIGVSTPATEEIEKDLYRSLPEYKGFQSEEGIGSLRRVLTAYSFRNPELGYCQAMNLVVAAILIYMSEEQAFFFLEVLCDRLLPGYYSPTMHGTLLDQRVFESLVTRCLPMISEHLASVDVSLSVACLPWFLSLFINSMPLIFAFRVIDCFVAMGPKVLFQIALAIFKQNGEALLNVTDDGMFIHLMRGYFATIGDSAHPGHEDPRVRAITNFQELLVVAFREFSVITEETIQTERTRFRSVIADEIESFSKRAAVRNLKTTGKFSKEQISTIYDRFFLAVCAPRDGSTASPASGVITPPSTGEEGRPETRIDLRTFRIFLSEIATWAREDVVTTTLGFTRTDRQVVDHELIDRIFYAFDRSSKGALSLQDVVVGLNSIIQVGLMESVEWFFTLFDNNRDGFLTKDEVISLSECLLFIFRNEPGDAFLAAVSKFIINAHDFGDAASPQASTPTTETNDLVSTDDSREPISTSRSRSDSSASTPGHHSAAYLSLATFRMVVLADPVLETFFESDLSQSFQLVPVADYKAERDEAKTLIGGLKSLVLTEENKSLFNKWADGIGSRFGKHQVSHAASLGRTFADPSPRESLLSPSQRENRRPSVSSVSSVTPASSTTSTLVPASVISFPSPSSASLDKKAREDKDALQRANEAVMEERVRFSIDEVGNDDVDETEDAAGDEEDEGVMDEVEAFLAANGGDDGGLTGKEADAAKALLSAEPMKD